MFATVMIVQQVCQQGQCLPQQVQQAQVQVVQVAPVQVYQLVPLRPLVRTQKLSLPRLFQPRCSGGQCR